MDKIIARKYAPDFDNLTEHGEVAEVSSEFDNAIRLYNSSPKGATLQIRGVIGLRSSKTLKRGRAKKYIATTNYLGVDDLKALRNLIDECLEAM